MARDPDSRGILPTAGAGTSRRWLVGAGVLALFVLLAAVYTRPLLEQRASRIASDPYDPILNTSILWWNATTLPFSAHWWNAPFFYPSRDVSAFTESLVGISAIASPIYWLTANPLATYNLALFLTWPLSAFAVYLLVSFLTKRQDAAFLAGLAYGFSPYRTAELGHLQMLSSYWTPVALLGLHGYLARHRWGWLALFGVAWLLQSLANGYLMLFGAVLVGLWLLYFCSTRESWRAGAAIVATWAIASLPLVPILLTYRAVLGFNGMRRNLTEPLGFSYPVRAWAEVSDVVWLWHRVLPQGSNDLFPGLTAVALVLAGLFAALRRNSGAGSRHRRLRAGLLLVAGMSLLTTLVTLAIGPWRAEMGPVVVRVTDLTRALFLLTGCGVAWLLLTPNTREAFRRRSSLMFYAAATIVMALFSCGPLLRAGDGVLFEPAPYRWLMLLPGFTELRVPTRFWMLGVLCLATAAGLSFVTLALRRERLRLAIFSVAVAGVLLDGWLVAMPMAEAPAPWPQVEPADQSARILELPIGPDWDAAATFRSIAHRRGTVNGVSGYEPAHYAPLQAGLNDHDPAVLLALASFGPLDVVVDGTADPGSAWARYVSGVAGVTRVGTDGARTVYRVPAVEAQEAEVGNALPIARVQAFVRDASVIADGRIDTEWGDNPQRPGQWVSADLGTVREVGGVTHALGEYARDFPRLLAIDVSVDGTAWEQVWQGPTAALAFRAAVVGPRSAVMRFSFPPHPARFVRLRQLANHRNMWRVAELQVHAPAAR